MGKIEREWRIEGEEREGRREQGKRGMGKIEREGRLRGKEGREGKVEGKWVR